MRKFDLALFLELNEAYRDRPLVPAPRSSEPAAIASRGAARAQNLARSSSSAACSVEATQEGDQHGDVERGEVGDQRREPDQFDECRECHNRRTRSGEAAPSLLHLAGYRRILG